MDSLRVLVVGAARSGTTWVAEVLARTECADYLHEPDSVDWVPFAARARAGMGLLPVVRPDQPAPRHYERLWDAAFSSGRRSVRNRVAVPMYLSVPRVVRAEASPGASSPLRARAAVLLSAPRSARPGTRHHIVKSVQAPLALEWIVERHSPRVVLVRRHPLAIVASRLQFGKMFLPDRQPPVDGRCVDELVRRWSAPARPERGKPFEDLVWLVGFTVSAYDEVAAAHEEFRVVEHEELCASPEERFHDLVTALGLVWTDACDAYLRHSNAEGAGFTTNRLASTQARTWEGRLTDGQLSTARAVLAGFPLARRYPDLVA